MPTYKQDTRLLALDTPLGKDVLLLAGFTGSETVSQLFRYQLEAYSTSAGLNPTAIVGKSVTWSLQHHDKAPRFFNGFVSRFAAGGRSIPDLYVYRLEVVPWPWFLTRTANCKIYSGADNKIRSGPEIIKQVFTDFGFSDYK